MCACVYKCTCTVCTIHTCRWPRRTISVLFYHFLFLWYSHLLNLDFAIITPVIRLSVYTHKEKERNNWGSQACTTIPSFLHRLWRFKLRSSCLQSRCTCLWTISATPFHSSLQLKKLYCMSVDGYVARSVTSLLKQCSPWSIPSELVARVWVYFHCDCTHLHLCQQYMRVSSYQHLFSP